MLKVAPLLAVGDGLVVSPDTVASVFLVVSALSWVAAELCLDFLCCLLAQSGRLVFILPLNWVPDITPAGIASAIWLDVRMMAPNNNLSLIRNSK